jgi:hypothetical protein
MPFRRATVRALPAGAGDIEDRLTQELSAPTEDPSAPLVVAEPPGNGPITRLFVIWDEWDSMAQQDRSEIIMNAYVRAHGHADALNISVAMGLTRVEAARMGIQA